MVGNIVHHFFRGIDWPPSGSLLRNATLRMPPLAGFQNADRCHVIHAFDRRAEPGAFSVAESFPPEGPVGSFLTFHFNPGGFYDALLFVLACDGMAFERIDGRIPYGVVCACVIMIMTAAYRGASTSEHQEGKPNVMLLTLMFYLNAGSWGLSHSHEKAP